MWDRRLTCKNTSQDVLVPNKFYKHYVQLYVSQQSKFTLYPITESHRWFLPVQHQFTSFGYHILIFCWEITPAPHSGHLIFRGRGPELACDPSWTNRVTMIASGMDRTMRISPRNFARTSGRVKLSLLTRLPNWQGTCLQLLVALYFATMLVSLHWMQSTERRTRGEMVGQRLSLPSTWTPFYLIYPLGLLVT